MNLPKYYKTAEKTFLGPIKYSSKDLGPFLYNILNNEKSSDILKNFYGMKGVDDNIIDSLVESTISSIPKTEFFTYGQAGQWHSIEDSDKTFELKGQYAPPYETESDTVFLSDKYKSGYPSNLIKILIHESLGHKGNIEHTHKDDSFLSLNPYKESTSPDYPDTEAYKYLEDEMTKLISPSERFDLQNLIFPEIEDENLKNNYLY